MSDSIDGFHRLFGDFNGDKTVNVFDLLGFQQAYLSSNGDSNYTVAADNNADGNVNILDLLAFRSNYRTSI